MSAARRLALFVREPVPGAVKTRLAPALGERGAAALYRAFLEDLADAVGRGRPWEPVAVHDGPVPGPILRSLFRPPWTFRPQGQGSLGERLARTFGRLSNPGPGSTVVAGSDVPSLGAEAVGAAFEVLDGFRGAAFAPSPDGGFSLVGISWSVSPAFLSGPVRWSTSFAMSDALAGACAAGLDVMQLAELPDVDEAGDLDALERFLGIHPTAAPATRRALSRAAPGSWAGRESGG